jgi:hypothetical protein
MKTVPSTVLNSVFWLLTHSISISTSITSARRHDSYLAENCLENLVGIFTIAGYQCYGHFRFLPEIMVVCLGHRHVELGTEAILDAPQNPPLPFKGSALWDKKG